MKNKENIQPSLNPKPITIQRFTNRTEDGKTEILLIRNVAIDPRTATGQ
jgi:hypothetical protein